MIVIIFLFLITRAASEVMATDALRDVEVERIILSSGGVRAGYRLALYKFF